MDKEDLRDLKTSLGKLMVEAQKNLYYKNILFRKYAIIDVFIGHNKKKEVIVRMNRYHFPLQLLRDEKEK